MQKKVLFNLLVVSIFGILLSTITFFVIQTFIARKSVDELSESRLDDVEERILSNNKQVEELIEIIREDNLSRARALAMIIEMEPDVIYDNSKLKEIADALDVDEIHIIDENGILQWGTQPFKYGMDFSIGEQTRPFLAILEDPTIEISQVPMPNASLGVIRQYAGVSLRHRKGIAEVGVIPGRLLDTMNHINIDNVLRDIVMGNSGYLFSLSTETGLISSHPNPDMVGRQLQEPLQDSGFIRVDGQRVRYHTRNTPEQIIVTAFPVFEMYEQRTFSTGLFFLFIILLFILFCIIINQSIKKNLVAGIHSTLDTLDEITGGNLNINADVRTNTEFIKLSDGINHMLYSIKAKINEVTEAVVVAEEASKAKSSFLANMSHEIRTPMNGIIGFSELALDDGVSPRDKDDYLRKIKASGEGLLQIINDILDISKIEAGKTELEHIPFDMHDVFRICQTIIMPKVLEKGITLYCYTEPSVGKKLLGDPTRLRQILLNLLSNAVKFTHTGTIKLLSSIEATTEDGVTMRFEVKDSGIGMSPEQIENIFHPFMQGDSTTTRKYGGTGLGLAITKNIVELMGGRLMVESAPGIGSKFSFVLTFQTMDTPSGLRNHDIRINELEKPSFKGDVLLCEDNEINQQVIRDHLARVGLNTVIASNGQEGVDFVRNRIKEGIKPFDLIFMDMHMPVMDGLEAAKTLIEIGNSTPIVAVTANVMTNDKETYLANGIPDFLEKPFQTQELWACLLKYLTPVGLETVDEEKEKEADQKRRERLLNDFVRDHQSTFLNIKTAIDEGNFKLAHRLTHTLKGLAGLMGKTTLQEAAGVLEQGLREGKADFTKEQMAMLEYELNVVLNELAPLLNRKEPQSTIPKVLDKVKAHKLFGRLEPLLYSDSIESMELVDELREIPETDALIRQIEDYEFEQALETLASIRKILEVGE